MAKKYAPQTTVSISKSREQIRKTLESFGASQMQWSDDFDGGKAMLRFLWYFNDHTPYMARFTINVMTDEELRSQAIDGRTKKFSQKKLDELRSRRGMSEHRELALLIKAIFVAVNAGIITPQQVFLPFLEDNKGRTVADIVLPQLLENLPSGRLSLTGGR